MRAAIPVGKHYVLAVRKPIDEVPAAVAVVRKAFITAALAGVALDADPRDPALRDDRAAATAAAPGGAQALARGSVGGGAR